MFRRAALRCLAVAMLVLLAERPPEVDPRVQARYRAMRARCSKPVERDASPVAGARTVHGRCAARESGDDVADGHRRVVEVRTLTG
jgi:hypothetical protein